MGYRSDVKYVICLPDDTAFTEYMAEVHLMLADKPDMKDVLDQLTKGVQIESTETGYTPRYKYKICVHWEWVKWYEGYAWVDSQDRIMELALDYDGAWFYTRLGEEDDDFETKYADTFDEFCVSDHIELRRSTAFV
jgi:hypothetical protein